MSNSSPDDSMIHDTSFIDQQLTISSIQTDLAKKHHQSEKSNTLAKCDSSQKTSKEVSKISPVVVYGIDRNQIPDIFAFDSELAKRNNGAKIVRTSFDKFGNLLIWPADLTSATMIVNNEELFRKYKKVDLNLSVNKPAIIIKNITYDLASKHMDKLKEHGIIELINLKQKNSENNPKVVKAICDSVTTRDLLLAKKITIGFQTLHTEPCIRTPLQCKSCHFFGHKSETCSISRCAFCGSEKHDSESCTSKSPFCVNCNSNEHTSTSRSCPIFSKLKNENLNLLLSKRSVNSQDRIPVTFTRNFSQITSNDELKSKIVSLENSIKSSSESVAKDLKDEISSQFANLSNSISVNITNAIKTNNCNIGYFVFNVIKSVFDQTIPDEKLINAVNNSFISSNLGNHPIIVSNPQQNTFSQNSSHNQAQVLNNPYDSSNNYNSLENHHTTNHSQPNSLNPNHLYYA